MPESVHDFCIAPPLYHPPMYQQQMSLFHYFCETIPHRDQSSLPINMTKSNAFCTFSNLISIRSVVLSPQIPSQCFKLQQKGFLTLQTFLYFFHCMVVSAKDSDVEQSMGLWRVGPDLTTEQNQHLNTCQWKNECTSENLCDFFTRPKVFVH